MNDSQPKQLNNMEIQKIPQEYVDPIIVNQTAEKKIIKRQSSVITCFLIIIALVLCVVISLAGVYLYKIIFPNNFGTNTTDNTIILPTNSTIQIDDYSTITFNTEYIPRNLPNGLKANDRAEIDLFNKIITLAQQHQWTGNLTDNLGFSYQNFKEELDLYFQMYKSDMQAKVISDDLMSFLINDSTQIETYIHEAKNNYLQEIQKLGFKDDYIQEINNYVLPQNDAARIIYMSQNFNNSVYIGTSTLPVNNDYGRRVIKIDPHDIYLMYKDIKDTRLGQQLDKQGLIKVSTKMVVYHEMSYVLMQAYINKHVPIEVKSNGNKNMWAFSNINFLEPGKNYYWAWTYNKDISDERIAQGLMLKITGIVYNLSEDEKNDIYDSIVKKDNYNMNTIQSFGEKLHDQYGRLLRVDWSNLNDYLYSQITLNGSYPANQNDKEILQKMFDVTQEIPVFIGKFNPASDKDWAFFKQ